LFVQLYFHHKVFIGVVRTVDVIVSNATQPVTDAVTEDDRDSVMGRSLLLINQEVWHVISPEQSESSCSIRL
jgi:hypothetical protein